MARAYIDQLQRGDRYANLKPIVGISLLDFDLFEAAQAHWKFRLRDETRPHIFLNLLQLHVLELRKLDRQGCETASTNALTDWVTFFKHWREDNIMGEIKHPPVQNALNELWGLTHNDEAYWHALARERALHDEASLLGTARDDGLAEGRREGRREGHAEVLARLLTLKFGELPAATRQALDQASEAEMEAWIERVLFASTLDDVFQ